MIEPIKSSATDIADIILRLREKYGVPESKEKVSPPRGTLQIEGKLVRYTEDDTGFHINYGDWQGNSEDRRLEIWQRSLNEAGLTQYDIPLEELTFKTINRRAILEEIRNSKTVFLYGPPGTGKTSIAVALGRQCVLDGNKVIAFRWREFLNKVLDAYSDDSKRVSGIHEEAAEVPILIIDEFATRNNPSPSEKDSALGILSRREGMGLSTIFTSNTKPESLQYGNAFKSRILASHHANFDCEENYRLLKREANPKLV